MINNKLELLNKLENITQMKDFNNWIEELKSYIITKYKENSSEYKTLEGYNNILSMYFMNKEIPSSQKEKYKNFLNQLS